VEHGSEDPERQLAKAIQTNDPVLLKKAVASLKQGTEAASKVEPIVLRAERTAAMGLLENQRLRINLEVMGLAARFCLGDTKSLETLDAYAKAKIAPLPPMPQGTQGMLPGNVKPNPAALEYQKQAQARNEASGFKFAALRVLSGLQVPGTVELIMQELKSAEDNFASEINNLVRSVLLSAPESGWKELIQFVTSEGPFGVRVSVFQQLLGLANPNAFTVMQAAKPDPETPLAEYLPKDANQQIEKALVMLVRTYRAPKELPPMHMGGPEDALLFLLQRVGSGDDLIAALNELKGKLNGPQAEILKQKIDTIIKLKQTGKTQVPTVPPDPKF